ncbi:MAG: glycoside hydrolase family 97 catalytic domain-containing protein [Bacteroidales bacterium]|nr:glycoside hydrolase family 97 catalytic domain-containing protein [Bacteroidales bacterium]
MINNLLSKLLLILALWGFVNKAYGQVYKITSPNNETRISVSIDNGIVLDVFKGQKNILSDINVGIDFKDLDVVFEDVNIESEKQAIIHIHDPVPVKFSEQKTVYSQLVLKINDHLKWELLLSDEGFAYRWIIRYQKDVIVENEKMEFDIWIKDKCYFPKEESMISHYERLYVESAVKDVAKGDFCSLPVLFQKVNAVNVLFTEADLFDYPTLFLEKQNSEGRFKAIFPKVILETIPAEKGPERNEKIIKEADYIAHVKGSRNLPWRVFVISDTDEQLVVNNMVYQLSSEVKLKNIDWIKPGKVAWDWWNFNNIYGVDFESGINNETYKYYIDFASEYGLDYIILDEGWSKSTTDILHCQNDIDVEELVNYGNRFGVGVILWTLWKPLDENLDDILDLYQSWGVKGIKVDFMQRADQYMVKYYERVAVAAAERQLLVDYHGAFKPAGLRKAYPNIINYEGLKGLENVKWSDVMTPKHNLTLPFIRMVAGPMDYTPGAMDNAHEKNFAIRWERPMSMGTRAHQVAMYVLYDSPLQMLCDNPSNYYREDKTTEFISRIPTTWDETVALKAKVGAYLILARRNGDIWYIGGMVDEAVSFDIDLSFLDSGNYKMTYFQDGVNVAKNAQDFIIGEETVTSTSKISVPMSKGGGFTAILSRIE